MNQKELCKKEVILVAVIFALISTVYYLFVPSLPLNLDGDFGSGAMTIFYSSYSAIQNGELSLWNPYMWYGIPAIGHPCFQSIYPIYLVIFYLLRNSSFELFIVINYSFHLLILLMGVYIFQRINKISIPASFTAALILSFSATVMFHFHWVYLYTGFVWFPLIIDFLILFERNTGAKAWRYVICAGITLGFSGLANPGQTLLINILVACTLYLCFLCNNFSKNYFLTLTFKMLCFGILGLMLCAPALFPTMEFSRNCARYIPNIGFMDISDKIPIEEFVEYDTSFASFGSLLQFPALNWDTNYFFVRPLSVMASLFGVIGFFKKNTKQERSVDIFCKICFAFIICYSTGLILPYIFYYIPFYNAIREPFLYIPYLILPLALFVGKGLDLFLLADGESYTLKKQVSYPICMCILLLITYIGIFMPYTPSHYNRIIALLILCVLFCSLFFHKHKRFTKYLTSCLVLSAFVLQMITNIISASEVGCSYKEVWARMERQKYQVSDYIRNQSNENAMYMSFSTQAWGSNSLSQNKLRDAQGYVNPLTRSAYLLQNMSLKNRVLISNIKYFYTTCNTEEWAYQIMVPELDAKYLREIEVYPTYSTQETANFTIWELETLGTAWVTNELVEIENSNYLSAQQITELLNNSTIDYRTQTYMAHPKSMVAVEPGENEWSVETDEYKNNSICFTVYSEKNAVLTTSEIWYPGWNVYVDGQKQELLQVNGCFRGCAVPSGTHTIEFRFEPWTLYLGLSFCALGILCGFIIWYTSSRKNRMLYKAKQKEEQSHVKTYRRTNVGISSMR